MSNTNKEKEYRQACAFLCKHYNYHGEYQKGINEINDIIELNDNQKLYETIYTAYNITASGVAMCHPEDKMFESEIIGYTIATLRSRIAWLTELRRQILIEQRAIQNCIYKAKNINNKVIELCKYYEKTLSAISIVKKTLNHQITDYIRNRTVIQEKIKNNKGKNN